jgi:biopolymer transport protein TolQ
MTFFNPFITAYAQSDFFGKAIIFGLVFLSAVCWVLLLYKIWITREVKRLSSRFYMLYHKNRGALLQLEPVANQGKIPHPFSEIFTTLKSKIVEILNKNCFFSKKEGEVYLSADDLAMVESCALVTISAQTKALEKHLFILSTIVTLAPFLGLLGTVWGILITFAQLQTGGSVSSNSAILGGLSTALVTTVLGLVIAIPALISYNYLKTQVKEYASDMEDFLAELLSTVELQYRKVDPS